MVEYDAWDFQDDDDDEQPIDPRSLPKQLRKVIKDAKAEAREAKQEAEKLRAENREILVGKVLTSKGVPEKVATLIPADVTSAEAIDKWLSEYSDLFPSSSAPAQQAATGEAANVPTQGQAFIDNAASSAPSADEIAAMQRMQATASTAQPFGGKADELMAKLNDPELTKEQLDALIKGAL